MTDWEPGDALHDRETSVYLARQWTAGGVPGPWSWLRPADLAAVMAA